MQTSPEPTETKSCIIMGHQILKMKLGGGKSFKLKLSVNNTACSATLLKRHNVQEQKALKLLQ